MNSNFCQGSSRAFYVTLFALLPIFCLLPRTTAAQDLQPGEWRTYTSMRSVADIAITADSSGFWAATSGGAFRATFDGNQQSMKALRNTDGLTENDLTAVATDQSGNVYFGGFDGALDIYSESSGRIQRKNDIIAKQEFTRKTINAISIFGDRVYLATSYGLTVFDRHTGQFGETITQFATLADQDTAVAALEFQGNTFVVLADGVATANSTNLSGTWALIPGATGSLTSIAEFKNKIYVGSSTGLFVLDPTLGRFDAVVLPQPTSIQRVGVGPVRDSIYLLGASGTTLLASADGIQFGTRPVPSAAGRNTVTQLAFGHHLYCYAGSILGVSVEQQNRPIVQNIAPLGPISSSIAELSFDQRSRTLYVANGGDGVSSFDAVGNTWHSFSPLTGAVPNVNFNHVFYDSVRSITWLSTQGSGLYSATGFTQAAPTLKQFGTGQLPETYPGGWHVGKGILDHNGNFVIAVWAANGQGLSRTTDGKTFTPINVGDFRPYDAVAEDADGNLWTGTEFNNAPPSYGVFWVRPDGTTGSLPGTSGGALTRAEISALIVDQDDGLWCGTPVGVRIISNISDVNLSRNPTFDGRDVPILQQQIVHDIAVDGVNNKWVGTENGVFVVSADGSDSIAHFSVDNSPLISNSVQTIAIDTKKGEAYLGTPSGISRLSTIFKEGKSDYSGLHVYPNPIVQSADQMPKVFITGLVGASTVKIYTISGKLVASIDGSQLGATVTWNGLEETGRQLPSGVYLVSATSAQTSDYGQTKFVLIRKP